MLLLSKNLQYHDLLMKTAQKKLLGRTEKANNNKQAQQKQVSQQEGDEDFFKDGLDGDFWNKVKQILACHLLITLRRVHNLYFSIKLVHRNLLNVFTSVQWLDRF